MVFTFITAGISFLAIVLLVPLASRLSFCWGAIDLPGQRRIHDGAIPRLGGAALFLSIAAGLGAWVWMEGSLPNDSPCFRAIFLGLPLAFLIGLWDDIFALGSKIKLAGQLLVGLIVWLAGFQIRSITLGPGIGIELGWFSAPVTALWISTVMNAVNLVDGMDGLAAGLVAIALGFCAVLAMLLGNPLLAKMALVSFAAMAGFLLFNFHPAKIFMGDSGSMTLGFMLSILTVSISPIGIGALPAYVPLLLLAFPLIDTSVAVARRWIRTVDLESHRRAPRLELVARGLRTILSADGDHIHHRLLARGLSQRQVALMLYGFAFLGGAVSIVMLMLPAPFSWLVGLATIVGVLHLILTLDYTEFTPRSVRRRLIEEELEDMVSIRSAVARKVSG